MNRLQHEYDKWIAQGRPLDPNGSVFHPIKEFYLLDLIEKYNLKTFVEGGTCMGDMVQAIIGSVDEIHTIEAWKYAYDFSTNRFKHQPKVKLYFGDSGKILPQILKNVGPSLIFLDAHYSGDETAQLDKDTPVVAELEAIAENYNPSHVIVVDDARGFTPEYAWKDYPTLEWIESFVAAKMPNHEFSVVPDEIFILPKS